MGKTLGSILAIGAAIAVNVIPGVGQALSAAIGSTLATAVISSVTLYGLQAGVSLVSGSGSPKPDTTETAIKTARPPRVSAYGTSRLYGAYALYETASNGTAVDVYAVHDGRLDGIVARYLGDETVTLTGTVVNQGADKRYKGGAVNYYSTDGSVPGAGIPAITALVPSWTGRGDGVVLLGVTAKSVKAKDFQETYPSSAVPVPSIVARWQRCPDPAAANPLDEAGWTWTENPVRQLLHYKLVREGPKPALPRSAPGYPAALATLRAAWWARKIAPTLQYWIDAAADCDAPRALKAGGTEPRYRSAVAHKHTDEHKGPVSALLSTFDGWLAPRADGALVVYSGRIYEPDPADLIGSDEIVSYTWEGGRPDDDEAVNEVICAYISADHDYNMVECDAWRDEQDITRRGQVLSSPLETQVPSNAQVRYLAKRLIARKNSPFRGTITTNIAGRKAQGKRFIPIHLEEAGRVFYSGWAEIISLTRNIRGGVTFQWVAVDPSVDNWNPATEEGEPAAKGNRVAAEPLVTPVIADAVYFDVGTSGSRIRLTVTAPDRADLTWYVRWRTVGSAVWGGELQYADEDAGPGVTLETDLLPADTNVEVQAAYQVGDGRVSEWSASAVVNTASRWDFSTGALPAATTFTRASTGTRINNAGALVLEAVNAPRFEYDHATFALRGLLIEPQRTNLLPYSEQFDNAAWLKSNMTVTADAGAAPTGGTTADKVIPSAVNASHNINQTGLPSTIATLSVFAKAAGETVFSGWLAAASRAASFNLATGAYAALTGGVTGSLVPTAGGFYRAQMQTPGIATTTVHFYARTGGGFLGTGTDGVLLWGAQLEDGPTATSYIPTAGAAATRSADVLRLNWAAKGFADGTYMLRYTFDDGSTQDVSTVVAGGFSTVPTNLNRRHILSARAL